MKYIHLIYTLLFGVAVLLFFGLAYPHHLHYQEQYQLFLFDSDYVWNIVRQPGGVADLLGRFCTQFFLYAWVGALIIALLLSAVQLLVLRLANWGWFYGLSFVPSFLLWLFLLDENALLGGIWAVLLTQLVLWGCLQISKRWAQSIVMFVAILIEISHLFQEHTVHRQGQILYRHTDLVVGFLGTDGLKDAVPLLVARHEVVLHHLLGLEIGVFPDKRAHDDGYEQKGEVRSER